MTKKEGVGLEKFLEDELRDGKFREISLSDLYHFESFVDCVDSLGWDKALDKFLYSLGIDTSKSIEEQYCTHRNMLGKVVTCARWVGLQRKDDDWQRIVRND